MKLAELFADYLGHLFSGRRFEARELLLTAQDRGTPAEKLLMGVVWPAMEQIQHLYRNNDIPLIVEHMASRLNRVVADQLQVVLPHQMKTGKRMMIVCGEGENEELGAQIMADLFEADGWTVWFLGSGVPNDEILEFLSQVTPDLLTVYGSQPGGVPGIRQLIDLIHEVGICEEMQILLSGGVFNRADGLAEEIGADLFAHDVRSALELIRQHPEKAAEADGKPSGRRRKSKGSQGAKTKMRSSEGEHTEESPKPKSGKKHQEDQAA